MITLITAVPGSGKTLYCIGLIIDALNKGRLVYTNINGLVVDKFPNNSNLKEAPNDWRDTPEGSLVIYDEAQQDHLYPSNAQRGRVDDERLTSMETHRHTGHDLVFVTQNPTFVHHHIRKLVGLHIHLYRARGVAGAMKYEFSHACLEPNDRREQQRADSVLWKFPKEHYGYYTSAVMHTHKFRMPKKLAVLGVFILAGIAFVGYNLVKNEGLATMSSREGAGSSVATLSPPAAPLTVSSPYSWSSAPSASPVAGCIASESRQLCQCYSYQGVTIDMSHAACMSIINSPLPRSINLSSDTKSS